MTDFARFRTHDTLRAAGLPTDLNVLIGRTLSYRRHNGAVGHHVVTGIEFGIKTLKLHLDTRIYVFHRSGLLFFDPCSRPPWEGWFHGEEEPESLERVRLL